MPTKLEHALDAKWSEHCRAKSRGLMAGAIINKSFDVKDDSKERSITSIISTEDVDRDGDVVVTKGLQLKNYRKNPVVLFMHDPFVVVAKSAWQKPEEHKGCGRMRAKSIFASNPFASEVFELCKGDFLRGWSIGMFPPETERRELTANELRKNPEWAGAKMIITKAPLLEYSVVTIPANQESLTSARTKGLLKHTEELLEPFIRVIVDESPRKKPFLHVVSEPKPATIEKGITVVSKPATFSTDDLTKCVAQMTALKAGRL